MNAPEPKDGWNVMQVGQIGWHVTQTADGWNVSRLFGPECLSREDGGGSSAPSPIATHEGGRGAADAPASPEVAALVSAAVAETWAKAEKIAAGIAGNDKAFNADRRRGAGEVQAAIRAAAILAGKGE